MVFRARVNRMHPAAEHPERERQSPEKIACGQASVVVLVVIENGRYVTINNIRN